MESFLAEGLPTVGDSSNNMERPFATASTVIEDTLGLVPEGAALAAAVLAVPVLKRGPESVIEMGAEASQTLTKAPGSPDVDLDNAGEPPPIAAASSLAFAVKESVEVTPASLVGGSTQASAVVGVVGLASASMEVGLAVTETSTAAPLSEASSASAPTELRLLPSTMLVAASMGLVAGRAVAVGDALAPNFAADDFVAAMSELALALARRVTGMLVRGTTDGISTVIERRWGRGCLCWKI